mmetsp:Transcript_81918/g.171384  ORF Transcript_81918/g.171384 Transcript_81918/m.171384 type:complete len:343 (+) Transcript_81918:113-1141(+)
MRQIYMRQSRWAGHACAIRHTAQNHVIVNFVGSAIDLQPKLAVRVPYRHRDLKTIVESIPIVMFHRLQRKGYPSLIKQPEHLGSSDVGATDKHVRRLIGCTLSRMLVRAAIPMVFAHHQSDWYGPKVLTSPQELQGVSSLLGGIREEWIGKLALKLDVRFLWVELCPEFAFARLDERVVLVLEGCGILGTTDVYLHPSRVPSNIEGVAIHREVWPVRNHWQVTSPLILNMKFVQTSDQLEIRRLQDSNAVLMAMVNPEHPAWLFGRICHIQGVAPVERAFCLVQVDIEIHKGRAVFVCQRLAVKRDFGQMLNVILFSIHDSPYEDTLLVRISNKNIVVIYLR